MGRRGRDLSGEERTLWDGVTRSIRPLAKRSVRKIAVEPDSTPAPASPAKPRKALPPQPVVPPRAAIPVAGPPLAPLERKTRKRLARGAREIDARLDLHGFTQDQAHGALLRFLRIAQSRGHAVVLVITGKGVRGDGERGVLKRAVPQWLSLPDFRELVIGFDSAAVAHGGEGALYVRVRRRKA
ncbi:MAG: Smr/MutS family protein [Pseudorhodoplanes sp.]